MNWIYAWMARLVAQHHENIKREIDERTARLKHARRELRFVRIAKNKTYGYATGEKFSELKDDVRSYMKKLLSKLGTELRVSMNGVESEMSDIVLESHFNELEEIKKDVEIFCRFVDSRYEGTHKIWMEAVDEHENWFKSHGLPVPPDETQVE